MEVWPVHDLPLASGTGDGSDLQRTETSIKNCMQISASLFGYESALLLVYSKALMVFLQDGLPANIGLLRIFRWKRRRDGEPSSIRWVTSVDSLTLSLLLWTRAAYFTATCNTIETEGAVVADYGNVATECIHVFGQFKDLAPAVALLNRIETLKVESEANRTCQKMHREGCKLANGGP